jgi:membrane associated rhomboid family serine protease
MTLYIIIITAAISLLAMQKPEITDRFVFQPYMVKHHKQWYRYITCGFLHGDLFHLFVNMFVLYSFGQTVEIYYKRVFGGEISWLIYILLYISSIFAANVSTYMKHQNDPQYRSLGASGAVSAVVFASILFNPYAKIYLYGIIGLPGIVLGLAYLGYSYYMGKKEAGDGINHEAHLFGALYGILFTIFLKPEVFKIFFRQLF